MVKGGRRLLSKGGSNGPYVLIRRDADLQVVDLWDTKKIKKEVRLVLGGDLWAWPREKAKAVNTALGNLKDTEVKPPWGQDDLTRNRAT